MSLRIELGSGTLVMAPGRYFGRLVISGLLLAASSARSTTIGLENYVLSEGPITVSGVPANLSGIVFSPTTGTLFSVLNDPERIVELNTDGSVIRSIDLVNGIDDTEAIIHLGGSEFLIVEERRRNIMVVDLPAGVTSIDYASLTVIPLDVGGLGNNMGLEGLAYDPATDTVYVTRESADPQIHRFSLSAALNATTPPNYPVNSPFGPENWGLLDLSGLHYDAVTGNLLVISDDSATLIEVATTGPSVGDEISRISLAGIPQAEGVTMGPDRTIYIVGEPDEFYVFTDAGPTVPEPHAAILVATAVMALGYRRRR